MRIAKYIAQNSTYSRRKAEEIIFQGRVSVNDIILPSPAYVIELHDIVKIDNQILQKSSNRTPKIWKFYKPAGLVCSTQSQNKNIDTIFSYLYQNYEFLLHENKIYNIGRLDVNSEGLLLITNTSSYVHELSHPKYNILRRYSVKLYSPIIQDFEKLKNSIESGIIYENLKIDGISYQIHHIEFDNKTFTDQKNQWISMSLFEGKNQEIRKIMGYFGFTVNRLIRKEYGQYCLGSMKKGELISEK